MPALQINRWWIIVLGLLIVCLGTQCGREEATTGQTVCKGIVADDPCTPPCWQMITPGEVMTRQEVTTFLEQLPNVSWFHEVEVRAGAGFMWGWKSVNGYNFIYLNGENEESVVTGISLSVDCDLTVEEILQKYGDPNFVNGWLVTEPGPLHVRLNLWYPLQGLHFVIRVKPVDPPILEPTTPVLEVSYSLPETSLDEWQKRFDPDIVVLYPWPGYGELGAPFLQP
ncbi:MAG TPA: hypothetical protein PLM06_02340 [Anaerolineae bacterium]|nr:hypothetical protein [Anaerolineae bacterium]